LRGLLLSSWVFWTANAAVTALLVPFVVRRLHGAPRDLGYLIGALGAGYVVGSLLSRPVLRRVGTRAAIVGCHTAVGLWFLALFHASSLGAALVFVGLAGVPGAVGSVVTQHGLQVGTPGKSVGRVGAVFFASDAAAAVVGALAGPLLVGMVGLPVALDAFSVTVLAAAGCGALLGPSARPP
jgi:predicted MFS family arabinose efflux permease